MRSFTIRFVYFLSFLLSFPLLVKKTPISPKLPSDNIKTVMHMHSTSKNAGCFSHTIIYSSIIHGKSINGEKNRSTQPIPNANLWWNILGMCWLNGSREIIINSLEFIRLEALNFNKPLNRFTIFFPLWLYRLKIAIFCGCDCHFTYAIQWVYNNAYVWFFLRSLLGWHTSIHKQWLLMFFFVYGKKCTCKSLELLLKNIVTSKALVFVWSGFGPLLFV